MGAVKPIALTGPDLEQLLTVRCLHLDQNFIRLDQFSISVKPIYHK